MAENSEVRPKIPLNTVPNERPKALPLALALRLHGSLPDERLGALGCGMVGICARVIDDRIRVKDVRKLRRITSSRHARPNI